MKKNDIRRRVAAQKSLLDEEERIDAAERLFSQLEKMAAFMMADNILSYYSLPDELPTKRFIDKWASQKKFYLPRVNGVNLDILPYERTSLRLGAFQIEEPDGEDLTPIEDIEVVLVPGVAYDRYGHRVGRGKGYYDRLLKNTKALKIGIAYDFQLSDEEIECDPHDVGMDIVLTDRRCIIVRKH